jgi:CRP/FNR family cyclic AMP-dependent transcriptional regulator
MPEPPESCRLLVEDAELAEALAPALRQRLERELIARLLRVPPGPWRAPPPADEQALGLLVLSGVLVARTEVDGRFSVELVGDGDLLCPWREAGIDGLCAGAQWIVLTPTRLALLDGALAAQLGRHPALAAALLERALRRARHLAANMAIVHQPRVEQRLLLVLWQLAGRWGRVRRDGVLVPVRLTHALLAELVAARRPTVSGALSALSRQGLVRQLDDGWLLLGAPPRCADAAVPPAQGPSPRLALSTPDQASAQGPRSARTQF